MEAHGEAAKGIAEPDEAPLALVGVRGAIGGLLMGLANLVPGISGGTMLLAAGVYPAFIAGIAEVTTFRFRARSLVVLASVAGSAALAILLLAGAMKALVVEQRWLMYSLFIGLTLGGVPLVWRLARPATPAVFGGAAVAFVAMLAMFFAGEGRSSGEPDTLLLIVSGLAGASAMILPGVSGGYLLLLLGQYETILGAIDQIKQGLLGAGSGGPDLGLVLTASGVVIPVGVGVVIGIAGVSNLVKWLLDRFAKPTLGALLGLLLGSVIGLWPFQEPVPPVPGEVVRGRVVTEIEIPSIRVEHWRLERFTPGPGAVLAALALVGVGFGATALVARLGADPSAPQGESHSRGA